MKGERYRLDMSTLDLIPYLLSDGGISPRGKASWTIFFRNKDDALIGEFRKCLYSVSSQNGFLNASRDGTKLVRIHSKELGERLFRYTAFRTSACDRYPPCKMLAGGRGSCLECRKVKCLGKLYPDCRIPEEIFSSKESTKRFLRVYFTCDGGLSLTLGKNKNGLFIVRRLFLSVGHPKLRKDLMKLLGMLGFKPVYYSDQIRIISRKEFSKFKDEIGFVENSKVGGNSSRFCGLEKNRLLDIIIKSYENPSIMIKKLNVFPNEFKSD